MPLRRLPVPGKLSVRTKVGPPFRFAVAKTARRAVGPRGTEWWARKVEARRPGQAFGYTWRDGWNELPKGPCAARAIWLWKALG